MINLKDDILKVPNKIKEENEFANIVFHLDELDIELKDKYIK